MSTAVQFNSSIVRDYVDHTPQSAAYARRARELLPSGLTHDARFLAPHGIYVDRASGAHKWDVDGHRMIDYFGGHGALRAIDTRIVRCEMGGRATSRNGCRAARAQ